MMKIKMFIKYSRLIESFLSLSALNALNVLLPLITLPYILRVIGPAYYGIYTYIFVLVQYILLVSTYGFNFSATKQVAQCRNDKKELNRILNSVILCRLLLAFISIGFIILFSSLLLKTEESLYMFLGGCGIVLGDIFIPVWLFLGIEKMRYVTIVNTISKGICAILIFIVIREPKDYVYIILLNSLGYVLAGACSIMFVTYSIGLRLFIPRWKDVIFQFREGFVLFGSTVCMDMYRNANVFILRFFVNDAAVGLYAAAEKVIKGIQMLVSPISQALFPHLSYKFKEGTLSSNISILYKVSRNFFPFLFVVTLLTFFFSDKISDIIGGPNFSQISLLIRIMSPVILFGGLNYILGIVGMVNMKMQGYFLKAVFLSGILSISMVLIGARFYESLAAAFSISFSEILLFLLCLYKFNKIRISVYEK